MMAPSFITDVNPSTFKLSGIKIHKWVAMIARGFSFICTFNLWVFTCGVCVKDEAIISQIYKNFIPDLF